MKTTTLYITCALTCIILVTACKKYPEGGIEKDGPKNLHGYWTLTLYEVDGIDSTELINYAGNDDYKNVLFTNYTGDPKNKTIIDAQPAYASICRMTFNNTNEILDGIIDPYYYNGAKSCWGSPLQCGKQLFGPESNTTSWKILKLDSKELHIQNQQTHTYNLKLVKIKN